MKKREPPSNPRECRSRDPGKGFSLIEMLIVLAVMGVMLGMAVMALGLLTSTSLSTSTRAFADFANICRSEAIAKHTAIRVGIVIPEEGEEFRRYSSWAWNRKRKQFEQLTVWSSLPGDVAFASEFPDYVRKSEYASRDASSVRGDFLLSGTENIFQALDIDGKEIQLSYFQFSPSGRVEAPGAEMRNLILLMRPSIQSSGGEVFNWSQINLDILTGRYRVYRP